MGRVADITHTVPEPCVVAGVWLKPFCLGHHLLFKRLGFPFANEPLAPASIDEHVIPAVAICAGPSYEWTLSAMMDGTWPGEVKRWLKRIKRFRSESEAHFRAYLTDGYTTPPIWKHKATGPLISFGAPWEFMLKCRLVEGGFDESAVLNGYLLGRWYDYYTLQEFRQFESVQRLAAAGAKHPESVWRHVFYTPEDDAALSR